ncbi:molybdopterin converting factor small subunit [Bacillus sp. TS-2]|nr:molybdopterin converting factor small subunit [Bacillus sp. TS-2]
MINVLLFAELREQAGVSSIEIDGHGRKLSQIINILKKNYPELIINSDTMLAVNEEYTDEDRMVFKGDQVALIPPVSGG